jgi:Dolichyl-phosphate-mannose-protein mannosyltransferase
MRWREAWGAILALFVASRGVLVLLALVLEGNIPLSYRGPTFTDAPILRSLTGSDSVYLLGIASSGYQAQPVQQAFRDWAFFPLYPIATWAMSFLTVGNVALAGILVANLAFVGALAVLYRLAFPHLGHDRAVLSLAFATFAPGAVAFAMAYTDSLFLLLAAASVLAAEHQRWSWMAALYALATLTRLQGIFLAIPLGILIVQASPSWRTPKLGWLLAGPVAFASFATYLGARFGQPLGMFTAQQAWSDIGNAQAGNTTPVLSRFDPIVLLLIGTICLYVFLLVYLRGDRTPFAHAAWAVTSLLVMLATLRIQSAPRYLATAWPFDWLLANRRAAWFQLVGLAASATLFVVFAVLHFAQALAP